MNNKKHFFKGVIQHDDPTHNIYVTLVTSRHQDHVVRFRNRRVTSDETSEELEMRTGRAGPAHRPRKKLLLSVKRPVLILISAYLKDIFSTINSACLIISVSHISTQISPVPPHCAVPFSLKS